MITRQRDRAAQGPLPVHRVRDRSGGRAAPRPRGRADRHASGTARSCSATWRSMPRYWTPWGTFITAEESWETAAAGSTIPYGRLFELKNPLDAPGIVDPAHRRQQRRRRLRAPERDPRDVARRHPVRQSRQHVLHRRAERRQPLQVHARRQHGARSSAARPTTSRPARPSCCAWATATRRTPPAPTPGFPSRTRTARPCPAR